jgi:hypothetical protein
MSNARWDDARRPEVLAGEARVNLLRVIALVVFYGHHLLNAFVLSDDETLRGSYNAAVTGIVLAWAVGACLVHVCLSRRQMPDWFGYVTTAGDLVLISLLLIAGGDGPRGPLTLLYFIVVAAAPLRLSPRLVAFTTLSAMAAAAVVLGHFVFWKVGRDVYYADETYRIPRAHEVIFLLTLGACGLFAGQSVRQARRLATGYPVVVVEPGEAA